MDSYENLSSSELENLALQYYRLHRSNGGASEFDPRINDISRARIEALRREKGACFLSNFNLPDKDRNNPDYQLTPYSGQAVHNFEYTIAVPVRDEQLRQLLIAHNRDHCPYDSGAAWERIQQISARIESIGGIQLTWA